MRFIFIFIFMNIYIIVIYYLAANTQLAIWYIDHNIIITAGLSALVGDSALFSAVSTWQKRVQVAEKDKRKGRNIAAF